ncbi:MAG TPA: CRISPR-associated endonuclease Cas2 [Candidatus Veblenbacteria bacterium]|uniref:CRISPR-associated endonuclease Cas2 n=2 Tax=Candidatus Vebleniibacteriota TaxID=1817921 RepID=A0A1G2Q6Y4_9BACT|nr:MAG: hypothetical protein UV47_C0009G0014 [Parcubacteria group bacterium GW2011_GWA2_42_80]KKS77444.1 MAG: hypothetical protein UV52_C0047G0006 [Parcubacteria group bacterium GW2011_GWD1_42_9]KKS93840.1 MAG: hypothetical protein UV69_C0003G0011 [Parcubacteria group bacterium GW2011_GWE2_43_12]KKT12437.1 MAG: hypothetical protein UV92_C0027G0009 [Parcubacteria group bacterium GW2011_GWA1_43_27]KKT15390.1 MAG: hypothetical protein UV96_C0014G0014 [Parcubacteria group bacterium GW2011_GWF2_43_3
MSNLPISKLLLGLLASTGQASIDFYTLLYDMRYHRRAYIAGGHALVKEYQRLEKEHAVKEALRQLKRRHYIKTQKVGKRLMVTLTQKGSMATLAVNLQRAAMRSDKLYTVVVFDVPQSQNTVRRQLRLLLRQGGFIKLQQSVWMSKTDTYELIAQFIKQVKLEPWVNVFRARDFLHSIKQ